MLNFSPRNLTTRGQSAILPVSAYSILSIQSLHKLAWLNSIINFISSFSHSQYKWFEDCVYSPGKSNESTTFLYHSTGSPCCTKVNSGLSLNPENLCWSFQYSYHVQNTCPRPMPFQKKVQLSNEGRNQVLKITVSPLHPACPVLGLLLSCSVL